ncbi:MAG: mechanosensitive ion channel [Planctomycetaceae bacterium]|nr:mechanosensitive ion channel [Planctomycetaceae bacterium]
MRHLPRLGFACFGRALLLTIVLGSFCLPLRAQNPARGDDASDVVPAAQDGALSPATARVDVKPVARDEEIRARLLGVLEATEWFTDPEVRVEEGVVFLGGVVASNELKKWAGDLAGRTQDVVAVANRIEVAEAPIWTFEPSWTVLLGLWREFVRSLPLFAFGLLILALSVGASLLATRTAHRFLRLRIKANLLRNVMARAAGILVFLVGLYVVLRVSGLTQLALTVVGGTGLLGLAVGIAFRDITENFLASIFLSMQRPFEQGDLVEIDGVTGFVQQLNVRTTMLMSLEGNLVQIPNATVYKSQLSNFTTNANRRADFVVGVGYEDSIGEAQEIARKVLADHPAILDDPEPLVLAENLGSSTVNLRIYFWLDGRAHSWAKVRSSVIRQVKSAFQEHGISMPDEAREIVFPNGVPVSMVVADEKNASGPAPKAAPPRTPRREEHVAASTKAEGGLESEADAIQEQAQQAQLLKDSQNLLPATAGHPAPAKHASTSKP